MLSIAERHKYILDSLNKHGFVRITDVANELGVTKVTIRKDIKILESKGLLYKVHGSARPANPHVADLDVHVKDNINRDAKRRIAQRAAEMLGETDSIIVASGSTVYAFAEEIKMRMWHHLNIVTPFLRLGVLLNESENVNVVQLGGSVHKKSLSVLGSMPTSPGRPASTRCGSSTWRCSTTCRGRASMPSASRGWATSSSFRSIRSTSRPATASTVGPRSRCSSPTCWAGRWSSSRRSPRRVRPSRWSATVRERASKWG